MTLTEWKALSGDDQMEIVRDAVFDGACPVLCRSGCNCDCDDAEPDGHCWHGCPSVLLAVGVI